MLVFHCDQFIIISKWRFSESKFYMQPLIWHMCSSVVTVLTAPSSLTHDLLTFVEVCHLCLITFATHKLKWQFKFPCSTLWSSFVLISPVLRKLPTFKIWDQPLKTENNNIVWKLYKLFKNHGSLYYRSSEVFSIFCLFFGCLHFT